VCGPYLRSDETQAVTEDEPHKAKAVPRTNGHTRTCLRTSDLGIASWSGKPSSYVGWNSSSCGRILLKSFEDFFQEFDQESRIDAQLSLKV
jgi:hypothetical protein